LLLTSILEVRPNNLLTGAESKQAYN